MGFQKNEPNESCPNRDEIRLLIQQKLYELQKTILRKKIEGKAFTASTLLENDKTRTSLHNNVGECFRHYINLLKEEERLRYAGMYEVSYNSFIKYAGTLDISFSDIDSSWLKKYEIWMLKQNLAVNTIGTRLRHLQVVFNLAIEKGVIKNDCYPFKTYKVSKVSTKTAKRALTKEDIMRVIAYKGKTTMEILAVDLFSFSYFVFRRREKLY